MTVDRRSALGLIAASVGSKPPEATLHPESATEIRTAIETYARAWMAGDLAAIVACYHPDFVLHYFGANPLSGTHVGKPAALAVLAEFGRRTNRRLLGIVDIVAGAVRGAIIARERLGSGDAAVEVERLLVYAIRDGLLVECWVYDADQDLIDGLLRPAVAIA